MLNANRQVTLDSYGNDKNLRLANLCFLIAKDKILLGFKKRGFGEGKWNGIGGKPKKNEAMEAALKREVKEEIGVELIKFKKVAEIIFYFANNSDWDQKVIVFLANDWKGLPIETEEMRPSWFSIENIPYEKMWDDDKYWLSKVLAGKMLKARFLFGESAKIIDYKIIEE